MKSLTFLWREILANAGILCSTSTLRDLRTASERIEHEGLSFITITLPKFGADFQKSLDRGFVALDLFAGFRFRGGLPQFLGGFLELVFDRGTGRLLDSPNIDAIIAVRQVTLAFAKLEHPVTQRRVKAAMKGYVECEQIVKAQDAARSNELVADFQRASRVLWDEVLFDMENRVKSGSLIPKHGPGATADRLSGNRKYYQTQWTWRLERWFPSGDYLLVNDRFYESVNHVDFLEPGAELPVQVIDVPKTMKAPRLIAKEPTCMQYTQQALARPLVELLERHHLLSNFIGFRRQEPNRQMAWEGSLSGELATLDLSDASDRVSNQLVRAMLSDKPSFAGAVDACRSRTADVRGHGLIRLAKYASMGSALCFPIEAMVFLTIVMVAISKELNRRLTLGLLKELKGQVRVYGDDIIVPARFVDAVITALEAYGLKVNVSKSFWIGKFRESCGGDYYDGTDVTPVRVRRDIPTSRRDVEEIASFISTRNQFYERGYWRVAGYMDNIIRKMVPFPIVEPTSPVFGRFSAVFEPMAEGICKDLHRPLVKGMRLSSKQPLNEAASHAALLKIFLDVEDPFRPTLVSDSLVHSTPDHRGQPQPYMPSGAWIDLLRSGRTLSVNMKIGMAPLA